MNRKSYEWVEVCWMELKNFMEDIVLSKLDMVLDQYPNCCRCDQCRRDIAILALNHLPAHYASTEKGEIFTRVQAMSLEYEVEVIQQIAKAIEIVSQHPRHKAPQPTAEGQAVEGKA